MQPQTVDTFLAEMGNEWAPEVALRVRKGVTVSRSVGGPAAHAAGYKAVRTGRIPHGYELIIP